MHLFLLQAGKSFGVLAGGKTKASGRGGGKERSKGGESVCDGRKANSEAAGIADSEPMRTPTASSSKRIHITLPTTSSERLNYTTLKTNLGKLNTKS